MKVGAVGSARKGGGRSIPPAIVALEASPIA